MQDKELRKTVISLMEKLGVRNLYIGNVASVFAYGGVWQSEYFKAVKDLLDLEESQKQRHMPLSVPLPDNRLELLAKELGYEWQEGGNWVKKGYKKTKGKSK